MNIGLSYMTQIRGGDDTGQLVPNEDDQTSQRSLGGWIALTFNQLVASLTAGYHIEHNANDSHSTIHATGTISERGRLVAIGDWQAVPFNAANFTGGGTQTWTVTAATQITFSYSLTGTTLAFQIKLAGTSVGGVPNTTLRIMLPVAYANPRQQFGTFHFVDNGVHGIGLWGISASLNSPVVLELSKTDYTTNWTAAAGTTDVRLSGAIEISSLTHV